jgi:hypothetical protein
MLSPNPTPARRLPVPRTLLCCAALAVCAWPAQAEQAVTSTETVIRLTVRPQAAPKPALRYLLLPELQEINPGNPIQNYLRCFCEQQQFFFDKESFKRREEYQSMPLQELPARDLLDYGHAALKQADWAARLDKPDWQILLKLRTDGIGLLIPDVQQMRVLAGALKVRFRAEVAVGRFDDAIRTAKTMFAISRHMGEHPTLIGDLVGIAIANIAIGPLEEMLEQPGSPNLYWALTNLPNPLISLEVGLGGERMCLRGEFHVLFDSTPMSEEQIKTLMTSLDNLRDVRAASSKSGEPDRSTRAWVAARTRDAKQLDAARRRVIEWGVPEERLARCLAEQVILLDEFREFEVRRDEFMKLMNVPVWQIADTLAPYEAGLKSLKDEGLFLALVPAMHKVRYAQGRLDQRVGLLRTVEALRMYAAEHDGQWPAKLSDVPAPLPYDPSTGKPFVYRVEGGTAHVHGSPPPGREKDPNFNVHYELTIRK